MLTALLHEWNASRGLSESDAGTPIREGETASKQIQSAMTTPDEGRTASRQHGDRVPRVQRRSYRPREHLPYPRLPCDLPETGEGGREGRAPQDVRGVEANRIAQRLSSAYGG